MTPSAWAALAFVAVLLAAWRLSLWWERRRNAPAERRSGPVAGEGAENGQTSRADEDGKTKSL